MATGKNVLITGASSGLGAGMAKEFASLGYDLALCARRVDRLEQLKAEISNLYPSVQVLIRELDVNDHQQVFEVFQEFEQDFGYLDRVVVNAGLGKGQPIGTGRFDANVQTAQTNFIAALAQCEAAMEIFRKQEKGHLVVISSVSAARGARGNITTYAATKAAVASLAEGIRSDVYDSRINVTTLFPGFIESEMNDMNARKSMPFIVDTATGCRQMVAAIEKGVAEAYVPAWPWYPIQAALRTLPLALVRKVF